jgi:hypothetical protein
MSIPEVFIREDGKEFIVRKGGVTWSIYHKIVGDDKHTEWAAVAHDFKPGHSAVGMGNTIQEAIALGETQLQGVMEDKP